MYKKIGIVTFHNALSYGAALQSYALQQFLFSLNIDNEIIDYQCEYIEKNYKKLIRIVKGRELKSFAGSLLKLKNKKKSLALSKEFQDKYFVKSKTLTRDEMPAIADDYRAFIAGSDQVWSPTCAGFDKTYFLDFAKSGQKYSYAVSFGTSEIPEDKKEEYKNLLSDFRAYSVREQSGKRIVKAVTGNTSTINIDPTLLLSAEKWSKIEKDVCIKKPYIFLFNVLNPKHMIDYAVRLGREKGIPVYYLNDKHLPINGINFINPVSPDEFVSIIKNAEYVVTNSFHGLAFSIIYHKNLVVELNTTTKRNIRAEELLKQLGIENREILDDFYPNPDEKIDWHKVDAVIEEQRGISGEYLANIEGI